MEKETVHKKESPRTRLILEQLTQTYPQAECELEYDNPFHLLVSVILSAQCTDKRVNEVTKELFKVYDTPEDFANADIDTLQRLIFSCGFYRNKSANIIAAARDIVARFNGKVPSSFDELLTLKGVGRKTANVVLSNAFGVPALAVDTHVFRVANRLKLTDSKDVLTSERQLMALIPAEDWSSAHHWLIWHGRLFCKARKPDCQRCKLHELCLSEENSYKMIE